MPNNEMNQNVLKKYFTKSITNLRRAVLYVNLRQQNSIIFNIMLICLYFTMLRSSQMREINEYDNNDSDNNRNVIDNLMIKYFYLGDPIHFFTYHVNINKINMFLSLLAIHAFVFLFYVVSSIFVDYLQNAQSRIYNTLCFCVSSLQKMYIWCLFYPSMISANYLFRDYYKDTSMLVLGLVYFLLIISLNIFSYLARANLDFIPKDCLAVKFSKIIEIMIIGQTALSLIKIWLNKEIYIIGSAIVGLMHGIIQLFICFKEVPFCNIKISKLFTALSMLNIYFIFLLSYDQFGYRNTALFWMTFINSMLIIAISLSIYAYIEKKILLSKNYASLSNSKFYHLALKLIDFLNAPINNKVIASFNLVIFLRNHIYQCNDDECPCKNETLIKDISLDDANILTKHEINIKYKQVILQIVGHYLKRKFEKKRLSISGNQNDNGNKNDNYRENEVLITYILYLIQFAKMRIRAYSLLCELENNKLSSLSIKEKFIIKNIRDQLEYILAHQNNCKNIYQFHNTKNQLDFHYRQNRNSNVKLNYIEAIQFFNNLQYLKERMLVLLEKYINFFTCLESDEVNLDQIIKKTSEIEALKTTLYALIAEIEKINPDNEELNVILAKYSTFESTDQLTMRKNNHLQRRTDDNHHPVRDAFFKDENCVLFVNVLDSKFGLVKGATPNLMKIFGLDISTNKNIYINDLIPHFLREYHDNLIQKMIQKDLLFTYTKKIKNVFALHHEGYIFPIENVLKMESFDGELCIASLIKDKTKIFEKSTIMTFENGIIMHCTKDLKRLLKGIGINPETNDSQLHIASIIPRLIFGYLRQDHDFDTLIKYFEYEEIEQLNDEENNKINLCGDLVDEKVFIMLPKSSRKLSRINEKIIKKMTNDNLNIGKAHIDVGNLLTTLNDYFTNFNRSQEFRIFSAKICYRTQEFDNNQLKIKLIDIKNIEKVNDAVSIFKNVITFFSKAKEFYDEKGKSRLKLTGFTRVFNNFVKINLCQTNQWRKTLIMSNTIESKVKINNDISLHSEEEIQDEKITVPSGPDIALFVMKKSLPRNSNILHAHVKSSEIAVLSPIQSDLDWSNTPMESPINCQTKKSSLKALNIFSSNTPHNKKNFGLFSEVFDSEVNTKLITKEPSMVFPKQDTINCSIPAKRSLNTRVVILESLSKNLQGTSTYNDHISKSEVTASPIVENTIDMISFEKPPKKKLAEKVSELSKKTENGRIKTLRNVLLTNISPPSLSFLKLFGISLSIFLTLMSIVLWYTIRQNLIEHNLHVRNFDYPDQLLGSISSIGAYIMLRILHNNNAFINDIDYQQIINKSKILFDIQYEKYDELIGAELLNPDSFVNLLEINYSAYQYQIIQESSKIYNASFLQGNQMIFQKFHQISNINPEEFDINNSDINFIRINFPAYFIILQKIKCIYSDHIQGDSFIANGSSIVQILDLIISIIVTIFISSIYPICRHLEKRKEKYLSYLTTISPKCLDEMIRRLKKIGDFLVDINKNLENSDCGLKSISEYKVKTNSFTLKRYGTSKKKTKIREIRNWTISKLNPLKIIISSIIMLGMLVGFYFFQSYRMINHKSSLEKFYYEADIASKFYSCFFIQYYFSYLRLNLVWESTDFKRIFFESYGNIMRDCENNNLEMMEFWTEFDNYILNIPDVNQHYLSMQYYRKEGNLCQLLNNTSSKYIIDTIECENTYAEAPTKGMVRLLNVLRNYFYKDNDTYIYSISDKSSIINFIENSHIEKINNLQYYGKFIIQNYLCDLNTNFKTTLDSQLLESLIFLIFGLIIGNLVYTFLWRPSLNFIGKNFNEFRKVYALFPMPVLIQNHYTRSCLIEYKRNAIKN